MKEKHLINKAFQWENNLMLRKHVSVTRILVLILEFLVRPFFCPIGRFFYLFKDLPIGSEFLTYFCGPCFCCVEVKISTVFLQLLAQTLSLRVGFSSPAVHLKPGCSWKCRTDIWPVLFVFSDLQLPIIAVFPGKGFYRI